MAWRCEHCGIRRRAEQKPNSLMGIIWRLHTRVCPAWKAYQKKMDGQGKKQ